MLLTITNMSATKNKTSNFVITAISVNRKLLKDIKRRVQSLKDSGECHSASDYFCRLARKDIAEAKPEAT